MATQYANGKIVTDGLVLLLDAADNNSYNPTENMLYYTSQIGTQQGTYYSTASATPMSISLNAAAAPDGTITATLINQTGSNTSEYVYGYNGLYLVPLETASVYTYSIYAKSGSKDNFSFTIDENGFGGKRYRYDYYFATKQMVSLYAGGSQDGLILDSGSYDVGNGWVRLYGTFLTSTSSVSIAIDMIGRFGTGIGSFYFWGRQLEKKPKPTSYAATTTTPIRVSNVFNDMSANQFTGTVTGSVMFDSSRPSFVFNATTSSYIPLTGNVNLGNPMTILSWVKLSTLAGGDYTIYGSDANGNDNWLGITNNSVLLYATQFEDINNFGLTGGTLSSTNTWYHIGATISGSDAKIYLNGVQVNSVTQAFTIAPWTSTGNAIGRRGSNTIVSAQRFFPGNIASIHGYNRALSQQEILQNYNIQKTRFGLT